jgi:hypothetical protein
MMQGMQKCLLTAFFYSTSLIWFNCNYYAYDLPEQPSIEQHFVQEPVCDPTDLIACENAFDPASLGGAWQVATRVAVNRCDNVNAGSGYEYSEIYSWEIEDDCLILPMPLFNIEPIAVAVLADKITSCRSVLPDDPSQGEVFVEIFRKESGLEGVLNFSLWNSKKERCLLSLSVHAKPVTDESYGSSE